MTARIDPSLGQAPGGPPPGRLGGSEPPVVRAGAATSGPFLLEGERVAVAGREMAGEHSVWVEGVPVLANLRTDGGPCGNVVTGPATLRRELLGASATLVESTLAAPALPMAAVQWSAPAGGPWPGALELTFSVLPGKAGLRYHAHGGTLRAVSGGDAGTALEVRIHPDPAEWVVVEGADGGMGVRASLRGPGPATLVVAAGTPEAAARAVAAAPHLGAHEVRAAGEADPSGLDTLRPETGARELDHGMVWVTARVRRGAGRGGADVGEAAFWTGMGALALGDGAGALAAARRLELAGGAVGWRLGGPVPARALATLLVGRVALLTGDAGPGRRALGDLTAEALEAHRRESSAEGWALWSLALGTLADALRHGAAEEEIAALRAAAARSHGRGGVRLPMAGSAAPAGGAGLLGRLLAGRPVPPPDPGDGTAMGCWVRLASGEVEGGYSAWRGALGRGLAGDAHGRGSWDPLTPPGPAPEAGLRACGFAHGLLGIVPDAPSGRIRLAPALPSHLRGFTARGIRVGEASLDLLYLREGPVHRLRLEPTRGRVPPMVVLEPSIPAPATASVRVDGAPAELDAHPEGARTRVRVQIPLDGPRVLEVEEGG